MIRGAWLFYQKLLLPSLVISILLGIFFMVWSGEYSNSTIGILYLFTPLLMQYFLYDLRRKGEYGFYHNLGLGTLTLWAANLIFNTVICISIIILQRMVYMWIVS